MDTPPIPLVNSNSLRLTTGLDILSEWAQGATEMQKTVVYEALFAVAEKSVFGDYVTVDDSDEATEFSVLTKRGLAVKLRLHSIDCFGVVSIGPVFSSLHSGH